MPTPRFRKAVRSKAKNSTSVAPRVGPARSAKGGGKLPPKPQGGNMKGSMSRGVNLRGVRSS